MMAITGRAINGFYMIISREKDVSIRQAGGFPCTEAGCLKGFMTIRGLERRVLLSNHTFEKQSGVDTVKQMWIEKCGSLKADYMTVIQQAKSENDHKKINIEMGWALKQPK